MDANYYKHKPLRVVWIGREWNAHTFCFAGYDAPQNVRAALARTGEYPRVLEDYYDTRDVAEVLGAKLAPHIEELARSIMPGIHTTAAARASVSGGAVGGADDDAEIAELERMLEESSREKERGTARDVVTAARVEEAPQFARGGMTIVSDMQVYPEDSFADVKRKIYAATRIPVYRQHLVAVRVARDGDAGSLAVPYTIATAGAHLVDFRDALGASASGAMRIFDIPVDHAIYVARSDLRVEARDFAQTIGSTRADFMIVLDLANWIIPVIEQVRAALRDNYQFELLYYGFVVKFFPQLTRECFHAYVSNEGELTDRFPDLAPPWSSVRGAVVAQCAISQRAYGALGSARDVGEIDHVILRATVSSQRVGSTLRVINLRDLFDGISCSPAIINVRAIADSIPFQGGSGARDIARYELRKFFKSAELMSATASMGVMPGAHVPSLGGEPGIIITYKVAQDQFMYMIIRPTGRASFQFQWREEDEIGFDDMVELFAKHTAAILREIREGPGGSLLNVDPVMARNIRIQSLAVATRWKRTISAAQFKALRGAWSEYIRAGIVVPRQTARDVFSFVFTRGINDIDSQQFEHRLIAANITESNQYAYLSVGAIRQKWLQNFAGRIVSVMHRASDVRFDVHDIYESEYHVLDRYLRAFVTAFAREGVSRADAEDRARVVDIDVSDPSRRRLRRLQEIDPVLYNLRKHGATRVYSTRCQHSKQPILYSAQEEAAHKVPRSAVKYWNFTSGKPAFYSCPDARYPHLNFIVGVHPKGYCIPCCGRMQPTPGSKHERIEKICATEHKFDPDMSAREMPIGYVMSFGKDLPEGRMSHLPAGYLRNSLNAAASSAMSGAELLVFGVPQDISIINTIRAILGIPLREMMTQISRAVASGSVSFDAIAGGRAATYFVSREAFAGYIANIGAGAERAFPAGTHGFMRAIMTDCVEVVFGLRMVYIIAADIARDTRIVMSRRAFDEARTQRVGLAIIAQDGSINPVLMIDTDDFVRNGSIASRTLPPGCVEVIRAVIASVPSSAMTARTINLAIMREWLGYAKKTVKKLYVGSRGLCYAMMLSDGAYVPFEYSAVDIPLSGVEVLRDCLDDATASARACLDAIRDINKYIATSHASVRSLDLGGIAQTPDGPIGFIITCGQMSAVVYCDVGGIDETEFGEKGTRRELSIDPRKQARMFDAAVAPVAAVDGIEERLARAASQCAYPYYEYDLFCMQFMLRVSQLRNAETRAKIGEIIAKKSNAATRREELDAAGLSRRDIATIIDLFASGGSAKARIETLPQLDADVSELYEHIAESRESLAKWLAQFMDPVVRADSEGRARVPAMIAPCAEDGVGASAQCDAGRLLIATSLETLAELLASDLQNPVKRAYILARGTTPESRAAFGDFTHRRSEVLLVRKYEV